MLLGACLNSLFCAWASSSEQPASTARRLAEQPESLVSPELTHLLGINESLLVEVQDDLLGRWASRGRAGKLAGKGRARVAALGPLRRYYPSPAQDLFVRLHQLLFELELLPLSTWGGRDDFVEPRPAWLKRAGRVGRGQGGTLSRLGLNAFLLQHEHRVPQKCAAPSNSHGHKS